MILCLWIHWRHNLLHNFRGPVQKKMQGPGWRQEISFLFPRAHHLDPCCLPKDCSIHEGCTQSLDGEWVRNPHQVPPGRHHGAACLSQGWPTTCPTPDAAGPSLKSDPTHSNPTLFDRTHLQNTHSKIKISKLWLQNIKPQVQDAFEC